MKAKIRYSKNWMSWAAYKKKQHALDRIKLMREGKDPVLRKGSYYLHAEYNPYLKVWVVMLKVRKLGVE
jgi:hypothetical protein